MGLYYPPWEGNMEKTYTLDLSESQHATLEKVIKNIKEDKTRLLFLDKGESFATNLNGDSKLIGDMVLTFLLEKDRDIEIKGPVLAYIQAHPDDFSPPLPINSLGEKAANLSAMLHDCDNCDKMGDCDIEADVREMKTKLIDIGDQAGAQKLMDLQNKPLKD